MGVLTGSIHKYGIEYSDKTTYGYKSWHQIAKSKIAEHLPEDDRKLPELHQQLIKEFHNYPMTVANYGLTHYDIHFGNYLFRNQDNQLILFDFEMCCYNWFINDIAVVLYYALYLIGDKKSIDFQTNFMNYFWKGYESVFTTEDSQKEKIPKFLLYRDLIVYAF